MKNDDIDVDVELLLSDYKPDLLTMPQSLDVEDFAENYLGLGIHYDNLSHNGSILGMAVYNNRRIPVYVPELDRAEYCPVNANTVVIDNTLLDRAKEVLYRSTIPHECGHFVYHRQIFEQDDNQLTLFAEEPTEKIAVAVCRRADIAGGSNSRRRLVTDHDFIEHHAKYFSAALLMPKPAMRIVCEAWKGKHPQGCYTGIYGLQWADEMLAKRVSQVFLVSLESAQIRIKQLDFGYGSHKYQSNEMYREAINSVMQQIDAECSNSTLAAF